MLHPAGPQAQADSQEFAAAPQRQAGRPPHRDGNDGRDARPTGMGMGMGMGWGMGMGMGMGMEMGMGATFCLKGKVCQ